jgi:hypothetical protein
MALRPDLPSAFAALLICSACGDSALAGARFELAADLSGTVTTSSFVAPEAAAGIEGETSGVAFADRAAVYGARGAFASFSDVRIADLECEAWSANGMSSLRIKLPRGPSARWPLLFVPSEAERERVSRAFSAHRDLGAATTHIMFTVDLPGPVVSNGVLPKGRGVQIDAGEHTATLVIPFERAIAEGEPFEWLVSWK